MGISVECLPLTLKMKEVQDEEENLCYKNPSTYNYYFITPYNNGNRNKKIDTH